MRQLFRISFLVIIMVFSTVTASADKYSRAWKKIDKLIERDLPESAAKEIIRLWDMAAGDNEYRQMLKSAVYLTQVNQTFTENSIEDGIEIFNTLLPKLRVQEHKALCHAFLAKGYLQYKNYNSRRLEQQSVSDIPAPSMDMWTLRMISDTICYHLNQSMRLAGDVPSGYYEEFFPGGNRLGFKLRPRLMDMLMDDALITLTDQRLIIGKRSFLEDSLLYGSANEFLRAVENVGPDDPDLWPFYVLKSLTLNNMDSKPSIRATIDFRRMSLLSDYMEANFTSTWDKTLDRWVEGTVKLAQNYEKRVNFSTMFYAMASRMIVTYIPSFENEPDRQVAMQKMAYDLCVQAQKKWPKSEGAFECFKIKEEMESKTLTLSNNRRDLVAGEHNPIMLSYSNTNRVYLKIIEVTGRYGNDFSKEILPDLNRITPVEEWSVSLNDPGDRLKHYTILEIPPVMQGYYYLMASTGPYFNDDDYIAYQYLECNGLGLVCTTESDGTFTGITVNLKSGKPVPSCRYTVWELDGSNIQVKVATQGLSSDEGFLSIGGLKNGRYRMELEQGENIGNCIFNIPWVRNSPDRAMAQIFTDRYTYMPGDSVQFTCVVYLPEGYNMGNVLKGVPVETDFRDVNNNKEIAEKMLLTTDSMGVVRGSFKLPENIIPGRVRITAESPDNGSEDTFSAISLINVESFRQPKFEIRMDPVTDETLLDRPFTLSGKVLSLTGVPVNGADVRWTASVGSYQVHPFHLKVDGNNVRINSGELKTASDGSFRFTLTVPSDILFDGNYCRVSFNITATDLNGETRDRSLFISLDAENRISIEPVRDVMDKDGNSEIKVRLYSGDNLIEGNVHLTVSRVETAPLGLLFPFEDFIAIGTKRQIDELRECVESRNLRERFPKYDFRFDEKPETVETVFDGTVETSSVDAGRVTLSGLKSGLYRIKATSENAAEHNIYTVFVEENDYDFAPPYEYIWNSASNDYSWESLSAEVGDTVSIRLASCLPDAVIHYYVKNRFGVCSHGSIQTDGKQQVLTVPVTDDMTGTLFVELGMVYGGFCRNRVISYEVENSKKQLNVELITFRNFLEPDTPEEWKIRVTDKIGNPVTAAVMLDMYDTALDYYGSHRWHFSPLSPVNVRIEGQIISSPFRSAYVFLPEKYYLMGNRQYKGKKAITGTLLNPFEYYARRKTSEMMLRGVAGVGSNQLVFATLNEPELEKISVAEDALMSDHLGSVDGSGELAPVTLRTDMNPTGLFEYLITDSVGMATVRFNAPQLLTRWRLQGIAFTDSLKTGRIERTLITRKLIMVEPAAPRFLRQGDRMEFTVKVSNLTAGDVRAKVTLSFTDAITGESINIIEGVSSNTVTIPAGGNEGTGFIINVPAGLTAVTYRITAQTESHSDGMEETIPVLSNRTQVVQALSLFNNGNERRTFQFKELAEPRSRTMADEQLTLEYSGNPIWYAVQALPSLIRIDDPSNLRLFHSFMGAAISQELSRRNPAIRQMLDEWAGLPASEWQTQLERNQKLTGILLEETPWLRSSQGERDRLRSLATALDSDEIVRTMQEALDKLIAAQMSDGGWPWIEGSPSNIHISNEILQGLGLLIENTMVEVTPELKETVRKGLDYLDRYFYRSYNVRERPQSLGYSELSYLMTRSYFTSYQMGDSIRAGYTHYMNLAKTQDTHDLNLYYRATLALLMARQGNMEQAEHIAATLTERSLYEDEMGRYWRDNRGGLLWHEAPIETQSLIIRTLLAVGREAEASEAARWLLKQKQTTGWCSSPATAAAVTALMAAGGSVQLETDPEITITVGNDLVEVSDSKATAGYTTHTWDGNIGREMASVTVESKSPGISWGALYRSFTEEMEKVEHQENGISLKRTVWRVVSGPEGDHLEEVRPEVKLNVGDRVRIQFDLTIDRTMEYLQLSDMRAATFEPVSTAAGYIYNLRDDIGYYVAPGNTRNVFYIDRLNKGSYRIEYEVNVQKPGRFQGGIAVMQCLYAPAFRATTASTVITVE